MLKKIAAIQMSSGPQIKSNLIEATRLIREATKMGAQMVVLPESFSLMAMNESENIDVAETQGVGYIQDTIKQCAIENKVWIVAGSIPIKPDQLELKGMESIDAEGDHPVVFKASAASLMFNDKGEIVARYNKIHLFDVDVDLDENTDEQSDNEPKTEYYRESDTFDAGTEITVIDTPFGKIGLSICYDLRFPQLYQEMVKQGAEIFLVPSAFTNTTGEMHWEPLLRSRAIENQCYVIAPAQGGFHVNGRHTYGHSMVIDYLGQVQDVALKGHGIITIDIDLEAQSKVRKSFPVLSHSRL